MSSSVTLFHIAEGEIYYHCRAKYFVRPNGEMVLISTERASSPIFRKSGWEKPEHWAFDEDGNLVGVDPKIERSALVVDDDGVGIDDGGDAERDPDPRNKVRAIGRAKVRAFDYILCNSDLNAFCTLTFDPDRVNSFDYDGDVYPHLKTWLSNHVQRRDLKYVLVPELHKTGRVHMHMLCNAAALRLSPAISPAGRPIYREGKRVFNIDDWKYGFSTALLINPDDTRVAVSKYIWKYMGKQSGAIVGGRYVLSGGKLCRPTFAYADDLSELTADCPKYGNSFHIAGFTYEKQTYL